MYFSDRIHHQTIFIGLAHLRSKWCANYWNSSLRSCQLSRFSIWNWVEKFSFKKKIPKILLQLAHVLSSSSSFLMIIDDLFSIFTVLLVPFYLDTQQQRNTKQAFLTHRGNVNVKKTDTPWGSWYDNTECYSLNRMYIRSVKRCSEERAFKTCLERI